MPCRYLISPLWKQDPTGFVGSDFHRRVSQGIRAYPCHNLPHEFAPYHPQFGCIACWCFWSPIFIPFAEINRKEPSSLFHIVPKQQWAILSRLPQPKPFTKKTFIAVFKRMDPKHRFDWFQTERIWEGLWPATAAMQTEWAQNWTIWSLFLPDRCPRARGTWLNCLSGRVYVHFAHWRQCFVMVRWSCAR